MATPKKPSKQPPIQTARNKVNYQYPRMPKSYSLIKDIRQDSLYKANLGRRDKKSRQIIEQFGKPAKTMDLIKGNLYLMEYFEPKWEKELDHYDAMPCSLIFGKFKTKKGEPRILGFSIHYFPPRYRFVVLNKVMEIHQKIYRNRWKRGLDQDMSITDYKILRLLLKKAKLEFAIHEYIPELIGQCTMVPPSLWHIAVFSEGRFKKRTREMIMNFWKQYTP